MIYITDHAFKRFALRFNATLPRKTVIWRLQKMWSDGNEVEDLSPWRVTRRPDTIYRSATNKYSRTKDSVLMIAVKQGKNIVIVTVKDI